MDSAVDELGEAAGRMTAVVTAKHCQPQCSKVASAATIHELFDTAVVMLRLRFETGYK